MNTELTFALLIIFVIAVIPQVQGHGMMLEPVGRASRWRFNRSAPADYNDNQLYCGGFNKQWNINKGNCGLCGDDYSLRPPRPHEIGGKYGEGVIVQTYQIGNFIPVSVKLTANHKGYFYFNLCDLDRNYESESCYKQYPLRLTNGEYKYYLPSYSPGWFNLTLQLPQELTCNHCVLRWTYNAGNNWGMCPNGSGAVGCGPQENFRSCADIQILPSTYHYNYYSEKLVLPSSSSSSKIFNELSAQYNERDNNFISDNYLGNDRSVGAEDVYSEYRNSENVLNLHNSLEFNVPNVPLPILRNNRIDE